MATWDGWPGDTKDSWVDSNLNKAFEAAKRPANLGKKTPQSFFIKELSEICDDDYSTWLSKNGWVIGRIDSKEDLYGFYFDEVYIPVITPPTPPPETTEDDEPAPKENQVTGFLKENKTYVIIALVVIVGIVIFSINSKK